MGGAPVILYHALTGIKFAIVNTTAELANLKITKISFIGLKNTGSFNLTVSDNKINASDATSPITGTSSEVDNDDNVISQTFNENDENDLITYDATEHASNHFAPSFFNGGTFQNLNNAQASKTFWLIPQATTGSTGILKIEYTVNDAPAYIDIPISKLTSSDWQAGQIRV